MAWASQPDGPASGGLVSLRSTLLAGTVVLVVAAVVALVPMAPLSVGGLVVADPAADAADEPAEDVNRDVDEDAGLQVAVRGPRRLVPRHAAPLEVRVRDHGGALQLDGRRLLLTFELDLVPEARGWVVVDPTRLLISAADLDEQRIELRGFGQLPCGEDVGTLSVTAQELVEDGRTATAELTVPGQACDQEIPEAPDTVNQLEAPAPQAPARSARPAPRSSGGATNDGTAEAEADPSTETDPRGDDTEADDAGDGDGSTPGDVVEGIVDPDDGDDGDANRESDGDDGDAPTDDGSEETSDDTDEGPDGSTGENEPAGEASGGETDAGDTDED